MKKFLALTISVTMILASLTACGGSGTAATTAAPAAAATTAAAAATVASTTAAATKAAETSAKAAVETTAAQAQKSGKKCKIALVILSGDHGFTGESVKHAEMEADDIMKKNSNVNVVVKSCAEASNQISEIENLIAEGDIDAIMLWPTEGEALRSAAQTIIDAKIKLVVYDRLIENFQGVDAQIMGDNFSIGKEMGDYLNKFYSDKQTVNYLRFVGDSSTVTSQRSGGMDKVIDTNKFKQINETFVTNWSTEKAQEQMENWLNAHSKDEVESLDLIVTHDDEIVDGIMNALNAYSGDAKINVKLITSVGGREDTMKKFETTKLGVKFTTWFFAPSFIREGIDLTVADATGEKFGGTATLDPSTGVYLIPSFSISNAGNAHYDFTQYRASDEYKVRYSIGNF